MQQCYYRIMNDYPQELVLAKRLAKEAGKVMLAYFNTAASDPTIKKDKTIVTKADTDINRRIIEVLSKETPEYSIWGEEESLVVKDAKFTWVCDPVDGTMPFAKGLPIASFSLALVDENGTSVLGVVYDPFQDRLFEAVKGKGAYLNGVKISVSDKADLDGAYINQELWINHEEQVMFDDPKDIFNKAGAKITTQCSSVIMGCFVANGAYEALIFGQGKPEDIAALAVIVTEAGGKVTDLFGQPQRYDTNIQGAIVSNGLIHDQVHEILKGIRYSSKYLSK